MYGIDIKCASKIINTSNAMITAKTVVVPDVKSLPLLPHSCVLRMTITPEAHAYRQFYSHNGVPVVHANFIPPKAMEQGQNVVNSFWKDKHSEFRFITSYSKDHGLVFYCYMCGKHAATIDDFLGNICGGIVDRATVMACENLSGDLHTPAHAQQLWSEPTQFNFIFGDFFNHTTKTASNPATIEEPHDMRKERLEALYESVKKSTHKPDSLGFKCKQDRSDFDHANRWSVKHLKSLEKYFASTNDTDFQETIEEKKARFEANALAMEQRYKARERKEAAAAASQGVGGLDGIRMNTTRVPTSATFRTTSAPAYRADSSGGNASARAYIDPRRPNETGRKHDTDHNTNFPKRQRSSTEYIRPAYSAVPGRNGYNPNCK